MEKDTEHIKQESASTGKNVYIYMVLPFHIISSKKGKLFDDIELEDYSQDNLYDYAKKLEEHISPLCYNKSTLPGDHSSYYDFMRHHYGSMNENRGISSFLLDKGKLKSSTEYPAFKNVSEQFKLGAKLGQSQVHLEKLDTITLIINSFAGIGFIVFGMLCQSCSEKSALEELSRADFFRNIGWKRSDNLGPGQINKHSFFFDKDEQYKMTIHQFLECYLSVISPFIRFHQDRPNVLYGSTSMIDGNRSSAELHELAYEIIRVPDRNTGRFDESNSDSSLQRMGRNVIFTALSEGALIIESPNRNSTCKNVANKYFPAFFFALNQREVLLSTMQKIALLDAVKLRRLDPEIFEKMHHMRNGLLVLQLKQIFYSVSHLHEVEQFFNKLQQVFAVEKMLMENEQCVREMYTLLEVRRNDEIRVKDWEAIQLEEDRSKIINTILGAIGCLGLFSFLKDLWPFIQDSQYAVFYKFISVVLPGIVMFWLVWYMSNNKKSIQDDK